VISRLEKKSLSSIVMQATLRLAIPSRLDSKCAMFAHLTQTARDFADAPPSLEASCFIGGEIGGTKIPADGSAGVLAVPRKNAIAKMAGRREPCIAKMSTKGYSKVGR